MGKIMLLNASPRAPRSNSKRYASLFARYSKSETETFSVTKTNQRELCEKTDGFDDLLLVFPLYADGIPVPLLNFLKTLEENPPRKKPVISVLINCGFFEPHQNDTAVDMIRYFCRHNGYRFGAVLKVASGEAILDSPFRFMAARKIKKLAAAVDRGESVELTVTMPLTVGLFVRASTGYWTNYGKRNGITAEQMRTMDIEKP